MIINNVKANLREEYLYKNKESSNIYLSTEIIKNGSSHEFMENIGLIYTLMILI